MRALVDYFQRKKAAREHVRLSSLRLFDLESHLKLEAYSRLGDVTVDQAQSAEPLLSVGAYSYVRSGSRLLSISEIGRYCSIGRNVTLGLNPRNHPLHWVSSSTQFSRHYQRKVTPLKIGHDVWIGDNAVVMAGITIGHGAVIGCDAVVTKDVLPYQIVVGNPAKPIRFRFSEEIIAALLQCAWWQYARSQLDLLDFENVTLFSAVSKGLSQKAHYGVIELQGRKVTQRS